MNDFYDANSASSQALIAQYRDNVSTVEPSTLLSQYCENKIGTLKPVTVKIKLLH